ncbi:hypothetical protein FRC04_005919 [Tulasnella sp. 424]|nr:hypothetical protein FRC04_005919 [Tulasnella sp. 424]KAG8976062.1 hypothetical protein FRC05_004694 [Tulasnella sp. 425]
MDDVERRISRLVSRLSAQAEILAITAFRIAVIPITLPLKLVKVSIPPALHLVIFLSLLPLLGLFSISAGILVAKWIPTGWSEQAFLQYGQGTTPFAYTVIRDLNTNQPYDISVQLVVPTSQANYDLGNFMTSVTLMSMSNRTFATSQRPSLLVPPSGPSRLLPSSGTTTVTVPIFDSLVPGYGTVRAKIEVGRQDGWTTVGKGEGKELAVVQAFIKGNVKLRGLTAILAISPKAAAILTSVVFFFTSTLIALVLYYVIAPSFTLTSGDTAASGTSRPPADKELKPALRRRPSREIKSETQAGDPQLRRRRSRLSEGSITS